jgi:rod shape determining protein RodA
MQLTAKAGGLSPEMPGLQQERPSPESRSRDMAHPVLQNNESSSLRRFDFWLFFAVGTLAVISVFAVYSANVDNEGVSRSYQWARQIVWVVLGMGLFLFFAFFDYHKIHDLAFPVWLGCLLLLILVLLVGTRVSGAKSWLGWGTLGIQPAEFAKAGGVIALASFLAGTPKGAERFKDIVLAWFIFVPFVALIMMQPDFGSAVVFFAIYFVVIFIAGARIDFMIFVVLVGILTAAYILISVWDEFLATRTIWFTDILTQKEILLQLVIVTLIIFTLAVIGFLHSKNFIYYAVAFFSLASLFAFSVTYLMRAFLKPYQMMRLATFLDPNLDPQQAGYQVLQSLTAIGSGGLTGKGFLQGTHSHLRYLPEQSTDFIFSIISEETGLLGCTLIAGLYALILVRLIYYTSRSSDRFGSYLCAGTFAMILFHVAVNIGMVIGLVPITGIPLLLLSYGGSSVFVTMSLLGMTANVYRQRYRN